MKLPFLTDIFPETLPLTKDAPIFDADQILDRKRFQALLHSSGGAVIILDDNGAICHITKPARHLLGDNTIHLKGQIFLSLVHRKNLYDVLRGLERLISGRKDRVTWIFRLFARHKRWQWLKATAMRFSYTRDRQIIAILLQDLRNA